MAVENSTVPGGPMPVQGASPQFPVLQTAVTPQGILLTIMRSTFETQVIMIPPDISDQAAIRWVASRPPEVLKAARALHHQTQTMQEDLARVATHPYAIPNRRIN